MGHIIESAVASRHYVTRVPDTQFVVDETRCFGCAACIVLCPVDALVLDELLVIVDEPTCTHCELCIPSCPVFALSLEKV